MTSEIRTNTLKNRVGLGTVSLTNTGAIVSGIVTTTGVDVNGDIDVDGHTNLDNVSIAGVSTFSGVIHAYETGDAKGIRIHSNGGISATNNELRFNTAQSSGFTFNTNSDGTSSNERLRIKSDGKVGIGSVTPGATLDLQSPDTEVLLRLNTKPVKNGYLDIVSDANRRGIIRFQDTGGTTRWSIGKGDSDELTNTSFHISSGNSGGGAAKFVIDSGGKVGVDNNNPANKVSIYDVGYCGLELKSGRTTGTDNIGGLHWKNASNQDVAYLQSLVDGTIKFRNTTSLTERLRIDSSGRMGLGITPTDYHSNNTAVFQLKDGNAIFSRTGGTFLGMFQNIKYNSSDVTQYVTSNPGSAYFQAAGEHKWYTASSGTANNNATLYERLRIDTSGRLLIAKGDSSSTTSQVQIGDPIAGYSWNNGDIPQVLIAGVNNEAPSSGTLNIALRVADENNGNMFQIHNRGGGNSDIGQIYVGGKLGINEINPDRAVHIKDSGQIKLENTSTSGWVGLDFLASSGTNNWDAYMGILDSNGNFFIDNNSNGNDFEINRFGVVRMPNQPQVRTRGSFSTSSWNGYTQIVWATEDEDVGGNFSNGVFTVPTGGAGVYVMSAQFIGPANAGQFVLWSFFKNTTALNPWVQIYNTSTNQETGAAVVSVSCAAGDTLRTAWHGGYSTPYDAGYNTYAIFKVH